MTQVCQPWACYACFKSAVQQSAPAALQLLRIAEEGAYSGLVSGSVGQSLNEDAASARCRIPLTAPKLP